MPSKFGIAVQKLCQHTTLFLAYYSFIFSKNSPMQSIKSEGSMAS